MKKIYLILSVIILSIFSCQNPNNKSLQPAELSAKFTPSAHLKHYNQQITSKKDTANQCDVLNAYKIPVPYQLLDKKILGNPIFEQLWPLDSIDNLISVTQKSFFLGVYLSDLVYTIIYDSRTNFFGYYQNVVKLSQDLGIKATFTEEYLRKFQDNFQKDTIQKIISQATIKTCRFLEKTNQVGILPFTLVGSWAESMYLIIGNARYNSSIPTEVYLVIANQDSTINRLKKYIDDSMLDVSSFSISASLQELEAQLDTIANVYNQVYASGNVSIDPQSLQTLQNAFQALKNHFK